MSGGVIKKRGEASNEGTNINPQGSRCQPWVEISTFLGIFDFSDHCVNKLQSIDVKHVTVLMNTFFKTWHAICKREFAKADSPNFPKNPIRTPKIMKNSPITALAALAILVLAGCATQMSNDPTAPAGAPAATVRIQEFQAGYYGTGVTGQGTIDYQGKNRAFSISGVGAGGSGAQSITAVGKVYHLGSLANFPGTYTGARSGLTLVSGKMHERYENQNGVVIYLTGETSGLASSLGIDKIVISLK
jgi:hypothetical protein